MRKTLIPVVLAVGLCTAHGTLKRSDFGIAFGIPQPGSTMGVSDAVEFSIEAEFSGPAWAGAGTSTAPAGNP